MAAGLLVFFTHRTYDAQLAVELAAVLDGAHDVPLVTARDASGAALLICREGRCVPPTRGGMS